MVLPIEYIEMKLIKVVENSRTQYYAVTEETADIMLNVDYSHMDNPPAPGRIRVEHLGSILVEQPEN